MKDFIAKHHKIVFTVFRNATLILEVATLIFVYHVSLLTLFCAVSVPVIWAISCLLDIYIELDEEDRRTMLK